jgi:hypothetical protein
MNLQLLIGGGLRPEILPNLGRSSAGLGLLISPEPPVRHLIAACHGLHRHA